MLSERRFEAAMALVITFAAAGCQAPKTAAPAAAAPDAYQCHFAAGPITLDGKLDEPAWQKAQKITLFYLHNSDKEAPRTTEAMMLWDDKNIYIAARLKDDDIYTRFTKNDQSLWEDDVFEVFFAPVPDSPVQYEFEFAPSGAMLDSLIRSLEGSGIADGMKWTSHAKFAVAIDGTLNNRSDVDKEWTIEAAIPWSDFSDYAPMPDGPGKSAGELKWQFLIGRRDVSKSFKTDLVVVTSPNVGSFHEYKRYKAMRFVK